MKTRFFRLKFWFLLFFSATNFIFAEPKKDKSDDLKSNIEIIVQGARVSSKPGEYIVDKNTSFKIQIKIKQTGQAYSTPEIKGSDNFLIDLISQSTTSEMSSFAFDGSASGSPRSTVHRVYGYRVVPKDVGEYLIGPFEVKIEGKKVSKPPIKFIVKEDATKCCFVKMQLKDTNLFLWQEAQLDVKIYFLPDMIKNLDYSKPVLPDFDIKELNQVDGREDVGGNMYRTLTQSYLITPRKTGSFSFRPVEVLFYKKKPNSTTPLSQNQQTQLDPFFDMFFSDHAWDTAAERSNILHVNVVDLPSTNKDVSGIGKFKEFYFKNLSSSLFQKGEPISLTLVLKGSGNFNSILHPQLKFPNGLRVIPSKSQVTDFRDGSSEKSFEYIIQADKSGFFNIPAHEFLFFDTDAKDYKSLFSNELKLEIEADENLSAAPPVQALPLAREEKALQAQAPVLPTEDQGKTLNVGESSIFSTRSALPNWLFMILLFLILSWFIYSQLEVQLHSVYNLKLLGKRSIAQLNKIKKDQQYEKLYDLMAGFLSSRFGLIKDDFSVLRLQEKVRNLNLKKSSGEDLELQLRSLKKLIDQVQAVSFGNFYFSKEDMQNILQSCHDAIIYWDSIN